MTLPTSVVRGAGDSIVLVGGGDMMLAAGAGDPTAVEGHAGLADLAAQAAKALQLEGVTTVSLGVRRLPVLRPDAEPHVEPGGRRRGLRRARDARSPSTPPRSRPGEYPPRYADPSLAAAKTFAQRLAEAGITVDGHAAPDRRRRTDARELGVVRSAPLDGIVHHFLDTSDNTITEVVSPARRHRRRACRRRSRAATTAVLHAVGVAGVDTTGAHLSDASGLGAGSVLPPDLLLGLLRLATDPAHGVLRDVATGMPIAGPDRHAERPLHAVAGARAGPREDRQPAARDVAGGHGARRRRRASWCSSSSPTRRPTAASGVRARRSTRSSPRCPAAAAVSLTAVDTAEGPVDWELAARIAGRLAAPGPVADRAELTALVDELRDAAGRAAVHASRDHGPRRAADGTPPEQVSTVLVVDRPRWARANAEVFAAMTGPLGRARRRRRRARAAAAVQVGGVLALLSGKVLGQFDPFTSTATAAAGCCSSRPTCCTTSAGCKVDPSDFRLWVALHEQTHALQFAAAPWLADHLRTPRAPS